MSRPRPTGKARDEREGDPAGARRSGRSGDVVVIGGGIIGCAVARELASRGLRTTVVERGTPGQAATRAAGGMLSPYLEAGRPGPFLELCIHSLEIYPGWLRSVAEESGVSIPMRDSGKVVAALSEDGALRLRDRMSWWRERGADATWLEGEELRDAVPGLSRDAVAGVHIGRDRSVDNRRLGEATWKAAEARGASFRVGTRALGIESAGGAVTGVRLQGGTSLSAYRVVVAAGAWSGRLAGLPGPLPVEPVRGQMAAVHLGEDAPDVTVEGPECYLIPRDGGRVVIGATSERVGFDARATPGGLAGLLAAAIRLLPAIAGAPLLEVWAGLRPGTPDDLPVLGPDPRLEGLFHATGHYRNGILLAPITARLLGELLSGQAPSRSLEPFRPERFGSAHTCDVCGAIMMEAHCKIICNRCGFRRDCSDP